MALSERAEEARIEIVGAFRQIHVRTDTIIERDGVEIARQHHRHVLAPDADLSGESQRVRDIAAVEWTPQVKDAWAAFVAGGRA